MKHGLGVGVCGQGNQVDQHGVLGRIDQQDLLPTLVANLHGTINVNRRVSDPDPHVFALTGSGQKGKEMNE